MDIEWELFETRAGQAPIRVGGRRTHTSKVDRDELVRDLTRLLDRAAAAYRRPRAGLHMRWRPARAFTDQTWREFR